MAMFQQCCRSSASQGADVDTTDQVAILEHADFEPSVTPLNLGSEVTDKAQSDNGSQEGISESDEIRRIKSGVVGARLESVQAPAELVKATPKLSDRLQALKDFLSLQYKDSIDMLEEDIRALRQLNAEANKAASVLTRQFTALAGGFSRMGSTLGFAVMPEPVKEENAVFADQDESQHINKKVEKIKKSSTLWDALNESAPSKSLQIDINNPGYLEDYYEVMKTLGQGAFGEVKQAQVRATGAERAVKTLNKQAVHGTGVEMFNLLFKEIEVCKLVDHPNVIRLFEIFDDATHLHLVMELCTGGSLNDYIAPAGLTETQAAVAMLQIFRGVRYLHENMICHRDLKPDNILVSSRADTDTNSIDFTHQLRISDFGISCVFKKNQVLKVDCGTPGYMAPEVCNKRYNHLCDVWSCGAIMWRLMGGLWPCSLSVKMVTNMPGPGWKSGRSKEGQQLNAHLLNPEPNSRILLKKALNHKWIEKFHTPREYVPINDRIVQSLRCFRGLNKFKKAALNIIASLLTDEQIQIPRNAFLELDFDGDGAISMTELRDTLTRWKSAGMDDDDIDLAVAAIFFQPSCSQNNQKHVKELATLHKRQSWRADKNMPDFTYTEFIAATFNRRFISEDVCRAAFQSFDKDGNGTLCKEELVLGRLLGKLGPEERDHLVEDLDQNGDGEIDFEEFCEMMKESKGWHRCFQTDKHSAIMKDETMARIRDSLGRSSFAASSVAEEEEYVSPIMND